jgi:hypothetical protein
MPEPLLKRDVVVGLFEWGRCGTSYLNGSTEDVLDLDWFDKDHFFYYQTSSLRD